MNISNQFSLACILFAFSAGANAIIIDTTGSWNGSDSVKPFGESDTATYGQTFTTGSTIVLDSYTMFLDDYLDADSPDFVDFEAIIYAWDGAKATGAPLFKSAPISTTNNGGSDGFEAITVNTGGIVLAAATQYVAAITASNLFDGEIGLARLGCVGEGCLSGDVFPGGNFVYLNNGDNFGALTARAWKQRVGDLAFIGSYVAYVPTPTSLALLSLGLASLGWTRRKKMQ